MSNRDPNKYLADEDDLHLIPRWKEMLDKIYSELLGLSEERQVMAEALRVINDNARLLEHPIRRYYLDATRRWYGIAMAIAVRRQVDPDRRSASLCVLIQELGARPGAYRIETLRQLNPSASDAAIATLGFALKDANSNLDIAKLRADLDLLDELDRQVGNYVDRHVAHTNFDPSRDVPGPMFSDIEDSFEQLERVAGRYMNLFYGGSYTLHVGMSHGWIDGFEFPWRVRPAPAALDTKTFLVRVDTLVDGESAEAFHEASLESEAVQSRRREFVLQMVEKALTLQPYERASEIFVPDDVSIERLQ